MKAGFRVQQALVALGFGHLFDSGDGDDADILDDLVRRQRETGIRGLGQALKSFRDGDEHDWVIPHAHAGSIVDGVGDRRADFGGVEVSSSPLLVTLPTALSPDG